VDKGIRLSLAIQAQIIGKDKDELVKLEDDKRSDAQMTGSCDLGIRYWYPRLKSIFSGHRQTYAIG
jgi:hypothetical protein